MKKLIKSIILFVTASILLSSCSSKLSLTKRHYRKGYYVNNSHKPTTTKIKGDDRNANTKPIITELAMQESIYMEPISDNKILQSSTSNNYSGNNELKKQTISYHKITKTETETYVNKQNIIIRNVKQLNKTVKNSRSDGDGLSLFWVVILVILILWLLGFLAGGFGLGGLINLLLVVALILLILWLLRVI